MNDASTGGVRTLGPATGASPLEQLARRRVLGRLGRMRAGRLTLADRTATVELGTGHAPAARVEVHGADFYRRVLFGGGLGAAESFMDGGWSADDLTATLRLFARNLQLADSMDRGWAALRSLPARALHAMRANTPRGSVRNIHAHYDLGNDFFELFLDPTMNYSAGIFQHPAQTMEDASVAKMERVCRKLRLGESDHLLDIGAGWGGLAIHAAREYGCRVTAATISNEQHAYATRRVREAGLDGRVEILLSDYRDLDGRYDKLASVEMIEAVGHRYVDTYFQQCARLLKPDGLMLLQAIVTPEYRYESSRRSVDVIRRYIFPGSCLTSLGRISRALARTTDFSILHLEDIGPHYASTLRRWRRRFLENAGRARALGFDERFIRLWRYYLCYCEAGFEERIVGDVQLLLGRSQQRHPSMLGHIGGEAAAGERLVGERR